jgi:hypothetical protein
MMNLTFKQKMQKGYVRPLRSRNYLAFVSSLQCPCGNQADEAHHVIDCGLGGGMGTKPSDLATIPICRTCHQQLHNNVAAWEQHFGSQLLWVYLTIEEARESGVFEL